MRGQTLCCKENDNMRRWAMVTQALALLFAALGCALIALANQLGQGL